MNGQNRSEIFGSYDCWNGPKFDESNVFNGYGRGEGSITASSNEFTEYLNYILDTEQLDDMFGDEGGHAIHAKGQMVAEIITRNWNVQIIQAVTGTVVMA